MRREELKRVFCSAAVILMIFLTGSFSFAAQLGEIRATIQAKGQKWIADETSVFKLPGHEKKLRLG